MLVNLDVVDDCTRLKTKTYRKKTKQQQPTGNHKNTKYQNASYEGSVFTFSLPGGAALPLPISYATCLSILL